MLKCVYALVGPDPFLQTEQLAELLGQAGDDIDRIDADGETAELADVLDELRTFTMFGGGKIVVVRNADEFVSRYREQLERFIDQHRSGGTLVLRMNSLPANQRIYKSIQKAGQVIECKPPKDLIGWTIARAKSHHKLTLAPDAAAALVEQIGNETGRLDNEIEKLAIQANGGAIDAKSITKTVAFQREQEMWQMTNELAAGRIPSAIKRWRQLLQTDPTSEFRAVTWLTMWLERVRKALRAKAAGANPAGMLKAANVWPVEQQAPFMATVRNMTLDQAKHLIDMLAEIDYQSKTGIGDMAENIERFLLTIAAERTIAPNLR